MSLPAPGPLVYGILAVFVCIAVSHLNGAQLPVPLNLALVFALSFSYYRYATHWSGILQASRLSLRSFFMPEILVTLAVLTGLVWVNRTDWNPFVLITVLIIAFLYLPPIGFKGLRAFPWFKNLLVAWAWALLGYLYIIESAQTGRLYLPAIFIFLNVLFVSMLFDRLDSMEDQISGHETLHHIMGDRQSILLILILISASVCEWKILQFSASAGLMHSASLVMLSLALAALIPFSSQTQGTSSNLIRWSAEFCLLGKMIAMILS